MENYDKKFNGENFYTGIDVHKTSWRVTVLNEELLLRSFSQDPDPAILVSTLQKEFPGGSFHLVYEAGFCGFEPCRYFLEAGMDAIVVNPLDVPTSGKQTVQKTDKVDSKKLAEALRARMLCGIDIPTRKLEADCDLVKQRQRFSKSMRAVKNRIKSLLMKLSISIPEEISDSSSKNWGKQYVEWLKDLSFPQKSHRLILDSYMEDTEHLKSKIAKVEKQLRELAKTPDYSCKMEILQSVPGFGFITSINLCLHLGDINRFSTLDMLCNYVGLAPTMHSSGEKNRVGSLTKRGRSQLREYLVEAAWIAVKTDPALLKKHQGLCKRMDKNKAIIRIAKSLLNRARHLLKNGEMYQLSVYP